MKHSHYFKDVKHLTSIDVYRVIQLFNVTDPCLQHALKKVLVAGGRGAGKDIKQDIQEAIDTLQRWQQMNSEDAKVFSSNEYIAAEEIAAAAEEIKQPRREDLTFLLCNHANRRKGIDIDWCTDCGGIYTVNQSTWGIASHQWFNNVPAAEDYIKFHESVGRYKGKDIHVSKSNA